MLDEVIAPSALGLDRPTFEAMLQHHRQITKNGSDEKDEMISLFSERDAVKLAEVFDAFQDDPDLCGLLATMITYINTHYEKRKVREKKYARSSFGMF